MSNPQANQNQGAPRTKKSTPVIAAPQDVLLASVTLALTLTKGRSQYEIETLINLFNLTTHNLQAVLAQMLINEKTPEQFDIVL